jgi:hypothetical protein
VISSSRDLHEAQFEWGGPPQCRFISSLMQTVESVYV